MVICIEPFLWSLKYRFQLLCINWYRTPSYDRWKMIFNDFVLRPFNDGFKLSYFTIVEWTFVTNTFYDRWTIVVNFSIIMDPRPLPTLVEQPFSTILFYKRSFPTRRVDDRRTIVSNKLLSRRLIDVFERSISYEWPFAIVVGDRFSFELSLHRVVDRSCFLSLLTVQLSFSTIVLCSRWKIVSNDLLTRLLSNCLYQSIYDCWTIVSNDLSEQSMDEHFFRCRFTIVKRSHYTPLKDCSRSFSAISFHNGW